MANNFKIRSACDACHRMKVRCTGDVPCEGCVNSGNLCFYSYSGRLGRPRGSKSHKRKVSGRRASPTHGSDSEKERRFSELSRPSPPRSADQITSRGAQTLLGPQDFSMTMAGNFDSSMPATSGAPLDPMLDGGAFGPSDATHQQQQVLASQNFDFLDIFAANGDMQSLHEPILYDAMDLKDERPNPLLPTPTTTSPPTPPYRELKNGHVLPAPSSCPDPRRLEEVSPGLANLPSKGCTCFQQNVKLLCSLKVADTAGDETAYRIDSVLQSAQEALQPWQSLVDCHDCAHNRDQEVLQVALMSIRMVLLRFQNLVPSSETQTTARKGSASAKGSPQQQQQQQQQQQDILGSWQSYGARMTLGSFEVSDSDNRAMVQVLLLGTLRKIKPILVRFKEMLDRKQAMLRPKADAAGGGRGQKSVKAISPSHPASNLDHIQHMLQGLGSFLQTLERSLEREQSLPPDTTGA